jgi:hypothetical protein
VLQGARDGLVALLELNLEGLEIDCARQRPRQPTPRPGFEARRNRAA